MKWQKTLSRNNSIFMDATKLLGGSRIYNKIGIDYTIVDYKIVNGDNFITNAYELLGKRLNKKLEKDPNYFKKIIDKCYQDIYNFILLSDNFSKTKLINQDIGQQLDIYLSGLYKIMAYLHLPLVIEKYLTNKINEIVSSKIDFKKNHNKYQEVYLLFTSAKKRSAVQQEKIEFLNLAQKIKNNKKFKKEFKLYNILGKNKSDLSNLINSHLNRWAWLGDHNFKGNFWSQKDLIVRLSKQIKRDGQQEKNDIIISEKQTELKYKKAIRKLQLNSAEIKLIEITREFVYLRTYRLDVLFISLYKVWPLFIDLEKKFNIKAKKFLYLTPIEINLLLNNKISILQAKNIIKKRILNSVLILKKGKLKIYSGQLAVNKFKEREIINKTEIIIGTTAYLGKVKGIARIVNTTKDLKKVKKGNILVTSMTTPDFVPAMEKASSFITDEGGILCHAAIVSREMKKPCIIGTKIATQVLKDGDLVEVDANKGVVRILKK